MVKIIKETITIILPGGDKETINQFKSALFDILELAAFTNYNCNSYGDDVFVIIEFIKTLLSEKALRIRDSAIEITMPGRSEDIFNIRNALLNFIRLSGDNDISLPNYAHTIYSITSLIEALIPDLDELKKIYEAE